MIQRIQTVYLFLGALTIASLGLFETPWGSTAASTYSWFVPSLVILIICTVGGALGAIFLYERRPLQRKVVVGAQVLTVLLAAVLYGGLFLTTELSVRGPEGILWGRAGVLLLPVLGYIFFLLARRGIDHDIELVKSMDRLR